MCPLGSAEVATGPRRGPGVETGVETGVEKRSRSEPRARRELARRGRRLPGRGLRRLRPVAWARSEHVQLHVHGHGHGHRRGDACDWHAVASAGSNLPVPSCCSARNATVLAPLPVSPATTNLSVTEPGKISTVTLALSKSSVCDPAKPNGDPATPATPSSADIRRTSSSLRVSLVTHTSPAPGHVSWS